MISHMRNTAGLGALETADAVGWGWTGPVMSADATRRIWLKRALLGFVVLTALAGLVGFVGFLGFVYSLDRAEHRPEVRTDGIVAMTGGSQRIGDAIDLLAQGYASRLLISGVNERTSRDEIARLNPGQRRLFDCCVDLDYRARNTIGNAIETRRWAEQNSFRSLIVVTSNYHMPRAMTEIGHQLPNVILVPFPVVPDRLKVGPWWTSEATVRLLLLEYLKYIFANVRIRFNPASDA